MRIVGGHRDALDRHIDRGVRTEFTRGAEWFPPVASGRLVDAIDGLIGVVLAEANVFSVRFVGFVGLGEYISEVIDPHSQSTVQLAADAVGRRQHVALADQRAATAEYRASRIWAVD